MNNKKRHSKKYPRVEAEPKLAPANTQAQAPSLPQASAVPPAAPPTQSMAQKRAKDALQKVKSLLLENNYGNYVSYVKTLPATIIMSGLGQALASEKAGASKKGAVKAGHEKLFAHMDDWLRIGWEDGPYSHQPNILTAITEKDEGAYIRAQAEAMEYLEWLKKFAVAYLNETEERGDD